MIYYSNEARNTALETIQKVRSALCKIPGDAVSPDTINDAVHYLSVLSRAIEGEQFEIKMRDMERRRAERGLGV